MAWNVVLAKSVQKQFRKVPPSDVRRLLAAFDQMRENPFSGDIAYIKGEEPPRIRRRVGSWRIFFEVNSKLQRVDITGLARRTSTTY